MTSRIQCIPKVYPTLTTAATFYRGIVGHLHGLKQGMHQTSVHESWELHRLVSHHGHTQHSHGVPGGRPPADQPPRRVRRRRRSGLPAHALRQRHPPGARCALYVKVGVSRVGYECKADCTLKCNHITVQPQLVCMCRPCSAAVRAAAVRLAIPANQNWPASHAVQALIVGIWIIVQLCGGQCAPQSHASGTSAMAAVAETGRMQRNALMVRGTRAGACDELPHQRAACGGSAAGARLRRRLQLPAVLLQPGLQPGLAGPRYRLIITRSALLLVAAAHSRRFL